MTDQHAHWNANLDPQNLRDSIEFKPLDFNAELPFYDTPDQRCALNWVRPLEGKRILEIGAGLGINAIAMAREGAFIIAADIARERLAHLQRNFAADHGAITRGKLFAVKCAAENLPFRDSVLQGAYTKSVLIHTNLTQSTREIARVLRPGATASFIEPLRRNPFVNLYRNTLAPKIWKEIATYFGDEETQVVRGNFGRLQTTHFYFFSFFAFVWQFAVPSRLLFRGSLLVLDAIDRALFAAFPPLRKFAWFRVLQVTK